MSDMSPRQRVLRTLHHEVPDRMPVTLDIGSAAGIDRSYIEVFRRATGAEDPAVYFGYDIRSVQAPLSPTATDFSKYYESVPPGTTFDEFGVGHVPAAAFPLGQDLHPCRSLCTSREIKEYPLPQFELQEQTCREIRELQEAGYAVSVSAGSINEWCYYLRGMDQFMVDLVMRPELAATLLERVAGLVRRMGTVLARSGVDILCFYGDVGGQNSLLMSPRLWSRWIKPLWRAIIREVRGVSRQVSAFYHSCGCVEPIIPDLIEVGFEVLNPVQPESMNPVSIKRTYGRRIALWGGIGMQSTMLQRSAGEVRQAVRELIDAWAPGGGAIVTAAQTMLPDVRWENVVALVETIRDHGYEVYRR